MYKIKFFFKFMLLAVTIFGMFFGIGAGLTGFVNSANLNPQETEQKQEPVTTIVDGERTNILVLGVDARAGEEHSRSDTMMLVSIDPTLKKIALVSIPRDTRVILKGNHEKINAANYYGGPEMAVQCVEDLMDIDIDNYVEMDFKGFQNIVDLMGGVTCNVPQRMYKPSENIDLQPGIQKLNGEQALGLVRFRGYVMGDIERTTQQQEFLKAMAKEMMQPATIIKLPKIAAELNKYIDTDLTTGDFIKLATWAPRFKTDNIIAQTLPGNFYDVRDSYGNSLISYWQADPDKVEGLLDAMLNGQTVADNNEGTTSQDGVSNN
jgi:LCP family protein required for cell wall assembly